MRRRGKLELERPPEPRRARCRAVPCPDSRFSSARDRVRLRIAHRCVRANVARCILRASLRPERGR